MSQEPSSTRTKQMLVALLFVIIAGMVFHNRDRMHFDWHTFFLQLRLASPIHIVAGIALILSTFWLRSVRWALFIAPAKRISPFSLTGSQFIGFTAVALFGRPADLARPYLISKRVGLSVSSQVAVYTIERIFDLGAAAVFFALALVATPHGSSHYKMFFDAGEVCLFLTSVVALFVLAVRYNGVKLANFANGVFGRVSKSFGEGLAEKILGFSEGLNALASARAFFAASTLSLLIWGLVAESYVQAVQAFVQTPQLGGLTFSPVMLLMAASMGSSLLQLPIIGWFTQIFVTSTAMQTFYGAPTEAATAAAGVLLIINTLCIIPFGLIYGRIERVSLKAVTAESTTKDAAAW